MIIACAHDGSNYDAANLSDLGFVFDRKRDFKDVDAVDTLNFVGFVSNENDDLLAVFPKHYKVTDLNADSCNMFDCIFKHIQKRPDLYFGNLKDEIYRSNYPFAAFWSIYEYYQQYGLYFEDQTTVRPNSGGRLCWKETISRSNKFLVNNDLLLYPLYYRKKYNLSNFVTDCMIYAIDYTIEKFGFFLNQEKTGMDFPEVIASYDRENIVSALLQFRQQVFKDNVQELLDNLIDFFSGIRTGGSYYLKHYSFSSIWEDMVEGYLTGHFKEVDPAGRVVFDRMNPSGLKFEKKSFHTNAAKPDQFISPDAYSVDNDIQLVFDAKYYDKVRGLNYKQVAYMYMLKDMKNPATGTKMYSRTCGALILPSDGRETRIHYKPDPLYGDPDEFVITEEYLDIREVIMDYLISV